MNTPQPPALEPEGLLDGLKWGCIIRGAVLDIVLTILVSIPLILYLAGPAALSENEELASEAIDQAFASPEGLLLNALVGLLATVAGAYYGARRARVHHLRHGGWVAAVSLFAALPFMFLPETQSTVPNPLWYEALTIGGMIPAGILGGAIAKTRARAA